MEEVEYLCNRICIMDQGLIIAEGSKESLIEQMGDDQEIVMKLEHYNDGLVPEIEKIDTVKNVVVTDEAMVATVASDTKIFKKLIDVINQRDINILSMDVNEPNLEKVFLKLTGRALRD